MDTSLTPELQRQVRAYFAGERVSFDCRIDLAGVTPFRRRVLAACRRIAYGRWRTYAELARAVGAPGASRAVGGAMANNPVPLVIPCHRVIGSDGALCGFSASRGVAMKRRMLEMEAAGVARR